MTEKHTPRILKQIPPTRIEPNPENPRLIFRQEEMETLMVSIAKHGIQAPITVYQDEDRYFLIDGERRWRCAKKLNLRDMPALVQDKPSPLENLLLMSNIHALREQWDYFTIASNLHRIIELFKKERGYTPNEIELSEATGLTRGQIRRCQLLLGLPDRFKKMLMKELELPKAQQKVSEDLFIEMEKSLKAVTKRLPEYEENIDEIRDTLVKKFKNGAINAVTDFRQLSKIATAIDNLGIKQKTAKNALNKIFDSNNKVGIRDVYQRTVEFEYDEKKAAQQVLYLNEYFDEILEEGRKTELDKEFLGLLQELYKRLKTLLRN